MKSLTNMLPYAKSPLSRQNLYCLYLKQYRFKLKANKSPNIKENRKNILYLGLNKSRSGVPEKEKAGLKKLMGTS